MFQLNNKLELDANWPLTSRDGRYVLHYDGGGVATLIDTASGEIRWRAGAAGTLGLVSDGVLRVRNSDHEQLRATDPLDPDAQTAEISDDGDLELLNAIGVRLFNFRTGAAEVRVLRGSAPPAAIGLEAPLVHGAVTNTAWPATGTARFKSTGGCRAHPRLVTRYLAGWRAGSHNKTALS